MRRAPRKCSLCRQLGHQKSHCLRLDRSPPRRTEPERVNEDDDEGGIELAPNIEEDAEEDSDGNSNDEPEGNPTDKYHYQLYCEPEDGWEDCPFL